MNASNDQVVQGSTPALVCQFSGHDFSACKATMTVTTRAKKIVRNSDTLTVAYDDGITTVVAYFTQEETLAMGTGTARVEIKFIDSDGMVYPSIKKEFTIIASDINWVITF